ncbi:hypothetical protein B0E52_01925 [Rhodanobacter sp. C06]|uniref:energy transducer TonB n=1 Tax=Rhodanobacter sp. C06 TaxID=1945854 RepID=UPI00098653AC|nr:energy transducer TonB [Rhodanobacter sp. C06]OOG48967.1 hypothetical protein B0E52_01925 [Rhodanobacter sp. C06]
MKRWLSGLLCLVLSGVALAAGPAAVRKRVQASMRVNGTIEVAPDGSVKQYALDQPEKLPDAVKELLTKSIPAWRFKPVELDGKPVTAKAAMNLRVVASPLDGDKYNLGVAGAWFGDQGGATTQTISYKSQKRPGYPMVAAHNRVSGTVYVLLKVGRDGKVADAEAEQVDLRVIASDSELELWRQALRAAALSALKQDTFNLPTAGPEVNNPYWIARIPVTFQMNGAQPTEYGQWQAYVPGPVHEPEWAGKHKLAGSPDAIPEGGALLADQALHLLTSLGGT